MSSHCRELRLKDIACIRRRKSRRLTDVEENQLVSFMQTLTDGYMSRN
jgi:hypothetical protein